MMRMIVPTAFLFFSLVAVIPPAGAEVAPASKTIPALTESSFARMIKQSDTIVLYANETLTAENDAELQKMYGMNTLQLAEYLVKSIAEFVKRTGAAVDLYRVDWAQFSPASVGVITSEIAEFTPQPYPVMFTAARKGEKPVKVKGPVRPDAETWFVHKMTEDFIPAQRKPNGDYLEPGWNITDTKKPYIHMVNERKGSWEINGKNEPVRIISYRSSSFEGDSLSFERIFLANGKLLGSIEAYGRYGKVGYFDYDDAGKMQYRVKYQLRTGM